MIEQSLNRHEFETGNAQPPYFVSVFLDYILQSELPKGYKVPKFLKYGGELEESSVEHVAYFQIECDDLAIDEFLKMKYFPSSLTKKCLYLVHHITTKFDIYLGITHFFRGETKDSLIGLTTIKHFNSETIEDYLNRF